MLNGKKVLLGITGGIAAYKCAELCRLFCKQNADVRVVMTHAACEFISPLTFQALSGNPVHTTLLDPGAEAGMGHIELAKWPDLILVAPATANFIAKYTGGMADDLLTTLLLASEAPVAVAPAMNQAMWLNSLTQRNLKELKALLGEHVVLLGPGDGEQACGDVGAGRMLEPADLYQEAEKLLLRSPRIESLALYGKKVVITAGPTREAIDPVRYISNHSSGKMGYALASACERLGAEVVLVSGPVALDAPTNVERIFVESAVDMLAAVDDALRQTCDIFIAAAAVADYAPAQIAETKIKKQGEDSMLLSLKQNPDIVASVAGRADKPYVVGFAAETNDVLSYAASKRVKKGLDMIIANDVSRADIGFNSDENAVHIVTSEGVLALPKQSKVGLSEQIIDAVIRDAARY